MTKDIWSIQPEPLTTIKSESAVDDENKKSAFKSEEDGKIAGPKSTHSLPEKQGKRPVTPASRVALAPAKSYCDGHGFVCHVQTGLQEGRESPSDDPEKGEGAGKEFEVKWDGEHDPMNPRNMSRTKKWTIVLILSSGSTCV